MSIEYLGNMEFDISRTIRDYDFTRRSVYNLNRVVDSQQFQEMDSETIFNYLQGQMEIVSFGSYLKRYIYEKTEETTPFSQVDDAFYISLMADSFTMNRAPLSFKSNTRKRNVIMKDWLQSETVKRNTIFLLGFGLRMSDAEVSTFLTKVLKEQDFRFYDVAETVYWYCFHHGLPYSKAVHFLNYYENNNDTVNEKFWETARSSLRVYLSNEDKLLEYLMYLKTSKNPSRLYDEFLSLYERTIQAVDQIQGNPSSKAGPSDIEAVLYSGTPLTDSKNLASVTRSTLAGQFNKKRLSRQRLNYLLRKRYEPDRFDILTLLFLVYAITVEPDWPTERYMQYIDEANEILERCNMMGIYPVNPYESFLLMCLLTEEPLTVYNDVWEISYED